MESLLWAKELVEQTNGDFEALERFGFEELPIDKSNCTTRKVLIHPEKGVIVKRPFLRSHAIPACAVPTVIVHSPRSEAELRKQYTIYQPEDCEHLQDIVIQPKVEIGDREDMHQQIHKVITEDDYDRCDVHQWNVGLFEGRAVLFDW